MTEAFIYDALRTPRGQGNTGGALYEVKPVHLLTTLLAAMRERNSLTDTRIDDLIVGCATPTGDQGYNIARTALLNLRWEQAAGGMQINRFCTSGLEAVNLAAAKIGMGWDDIIIAGGMESMSRVPMGSDGGPLRYDPAVMINSHYMPQGVSADLMATVEGYSRETLDTFALRSHELTQKARAAGYFQSSLVPITDMNGLTILAEDEYKHAETTADKLAARPPAFASIGSQGYDGMALHRYPSVECIEHRHTAGNSCPNVDGAALVLVANQATGERLGLRPRARIRSAATATVDPTIMFTGPVPAAHRALERAGMKKKDIDLWECNEAFAAVVLKFQKDLGIPDKKLNVNGGAIALGHPMGAMGAILLNMMIDELERQDLKTGLITLCAGAGLAVATIVERM